MPALRLKSELWVKAYIRRCAAAGTAAHVVKRGDEDAGAIFIKLATLDGRAGLFGPTPAGFEVAAPDRWWSMYFDPASTAEAKVDASLERQREFDPDVWIIEVEDRAGRHFLEGWLAPGEA